MKNVFLGFPFKIIFSCPTDIKLLNKIDDKSHESDIFIYCELGMDIPSTISAQSGRGVGDLLDKINETGYENLTDDEKDLLYKASKDFSRNREKD